MHVNRERLWNHLKVLCEEIGPRLSGTPADERAVEYIAGHFRRCGAQVEVQDYSCPSWECEATELTLQAPSGPEPMTAFAQTFTEACDLEAELAPVALPARGPRHVAGLVAAAEGPRYGQHILVVQVVLRRLVGEEPRVVEQQLDALGVAGRH